MASATKNISGVDVVIEYWQKPTTPPSMAYRAVCGETVILKSMTVHSDEPKSLEELQADHEALLEELAEEAATTESHRGHLASLVEE